MSDEIYRDSISVSAGDFQIFTNRDKLGHRRITRSKSTEGFRSLTDADLRDLFRGLNEYLHMMRLGDD